MHFETVHSEEIVITAEFEIEPDPETLIPGYAHLLSISIIGVLSTIVPRKKATKKEVILQLLIKYFPFFSWFLRCPNKYHPERPDKHTDRRYNT